MQNSCLKLALTLWAVSSLLSYLTNKECEAQKDHATCPRATDRLTEPGHRQVVLAPESRSRHMRPLGNVTERDREDTSRATGTQSQRGTLHWTPTGSRAEGEPEKAERAGSSVAPT